MLICTTDSVGSRPTRETLGFVSSEVVVGINLVRDWLAGFTDKIGGRSSSLESCYTAAREHAIHELVVQTERLGGNALVGVKLATSEISAQGKSMLVVIATGTAVLV